MAPEDQCKTAFACHRGKFQFTRMPFRVMNAPAMFQDLMGRLLDDCREFARPYIDDVIIFSDSWERHKGHVRAVLERLRGAGLTANHKKCCWGGTWMEFLGHRIGGGRMMVPEKRVEAIRTYKKPATKKGLRAFLGVVSFYRRYIAMLAKETATLSPATFKGAPSRVQWTRDMERAFIAIRECVCDTVMLHVPLPDDKFSVVTDASIRDIGGVLQVWRDDEWHAAAFYSRQTRGPEVRYSATKLEALAVAETLAHFAYYLYGRDLVVFTGHKPLCHLLTSDRLNSRLRRLALKLQQWMIRIEYLLGQENSAADALSRKESEEDGEMEPYRSPSGNGGCEGPPSWEE